MMAPLLFDPILMVAMAVSGVMVLGVCSLVFRFLGGADIPPEA
jgi:hypothetical protein